MKKFAIVTLSLRFLLGTAIAQAAPLKILFFYPGGQGSQEAAQPLLDSFAESLKQASGGKIDAAVTYLSDKEAGLQFIKTEKPAAAILSLDTYLQFAPAWGATMVAKTLQLPSGDGTDQYFIVGAKGTSLPSGGKISVLSSRPLDPSFLAQKLFPSLKGAEFTVAPLRNTMGALRAVGMGEKPDLILLDQYEWANVSRLRTAWVAGLAPLASSAKVSSAPVVIFPDQMPAGLKADFEKALVQLGQDSAAQATLRELRMKGFKAAASPDL